jgi:hypothetical protein
MLKVVSEADPFPGKTHGPFLPLPKFDLCEPLTQLGEDSCSVARWRSVLIDGQDVPSFVFIGRRGGGVPLRLAIVAGTQGGYDQVSSVALVKVLLELDLAPALARDYALFCYPQANPDRVGGPLNDFGSRFWRDDPDPAVRFLERELAGNELDGVIMLQGAQRISGFEIQIGSRVIATEVIWPALEIAQRVVPLASEPVRIMRSSSTDLLGLDHIKPHPYTVVIRTPQSAPIENQVAAFAFSLKQIFFHYRTLVEHAERI